MKHLNLKTFILAMLIIPFGVSCGDDDDNGNYNSNNGKRIAKIIEESQGSTHESILTYDEHGRVVKVIMTTKSADVTNEVYTKTYQYGDSQIIQIENIENASNNEYPRTHTYSLFNGLIVKDTEIQNEIPIYTHYKYDQDGYWIEYLVYKEMDEVLACLSRSHGINWENGLLSSITYLGSDMIYGYSSIPWIQGMIYDLTPFTDPILYAEGYFGKIPNYLPSDFNYATYQYITHDGLVTQITKSYKDPYNDKYSYTSVIKFIWE